MPSILILRSPFDETVGKLLTLAPPELNKSALEETHHFHSLLHERRKASDDVVEEVPSDDRLQSLLRSNRIRIQFLFTTNAISCLALRNSTLLGQSWRTVHARLAHRVLTWSLVSCGRPKASLIAWKSSTRQRSRRPSERYTRLRVTHFSKTLSERNLNFYFAHGKVRISLLTTR